MYYDVYHQDDLEYQGTINTIEQLYDLMVDSIEDHEFQFTVSGENIYVPFYAQKKGYYDVDILNGFPNIEKNIFF